MASEELRKFPNDPVLVRLLESAKTITGQIIHDDYGFDKTYAELLADIVQTRDALRTQLPPSVLNKHGLLHEDRPYICALTRGGYEFIVAFFAVRAIGGACMPLASGSLVEEVEYFMSITKAACLLVSASHHEQGNKARAFTIQQGNPEFVVLRSSSDAAPLSSVDIGFNNSPELSPSGPGMVLFTSGTTGKPKAAVLPRLCLLTKHGAIPGGTVLNYRPPHWRGGLAASIMPPMSGMKLYTLKQQPSAEEVWETLKNHKITNLIFNPTLLRRMMDTWENKLGKLPIEERNKYLSGFKNIAKIKCNGATMAPTVLKFWTELTGLPFQNGYGSTECGGGITETILEVPIKHKHGVGPLVSDPPVDVKLSEGDHGEILLKSPWMLTKYVGDETATRNAFTDDGYLKTGDTARLIDGEYVFEGRVNTDFINRIPRIPVEDALTSLPYIGEAYIVGVPGHDIRAYCGALLRVKKGTIPSDELTLTRLHADLSDTLPAFMRPYLLRVLKDGEEVPHTQSQKPIWREIVSKFFAAEGHWIVENPTPGVEVWSAPPSAIYKAYPGTANLNGASKPWDWGGLQMSG